MAKNSKTPARPAPAELQDSDLDRATGGGGGGDNLTGIDIRPAVKQPGNVLSWDKLQEIPPGR